MGIQVADFDLSRSGILSRSELDTVEAAYTVARTRHDRALEDDLHDFIFPVFFLPQGFDDYPGIDVPVGKICHFFSVRRNGRENIHGGIGFFMKSNLLALFIVKILFTDKMKKAFFIKTYPFIIQFIQVFPAKGNSARSPVARPGAMRMPHA